MPRGIYKRKKVAKKKAIKKAKKPKKVQKVKRAYKKKADKPKRKYTKRSIETARVPVEEINVAELDTSLDLNDMSTTGRNLAYDGKASIMMPGKNRNKVMYKMSISPFIQKTKYQPQQLCIGVDPKTQRVFAIFDSVSHTDSNVLVSNAKSIRGKIMSVAMVKRVFRLFNVEFPKKTDQTKEIFFTIRPVNSKTDKQSLKFCEIKLLKQKADVEVNEERK
jgi:hypothetical protein